MASTCICPKCQNKVVLRLQAKLDPNQVLMLGFFCAKCILMRCNARHKVQRKYKKAA